MEMSAALEAREYAQQKLEKSSAHNREELMQDLIAATRHVEILKYRLAEISNLNSRHESEE